MKRGCPVLVGPQCPIGLLRVSNLLPGAFSTCLLLSEIMRNVNTQIGRSASDRITVLHSR